METIYTTKYREIKLKSLSDVTSFWFFGDVHRDTASCDVDRWKWFLKRSSETDAYYFGLGDYHDFASSKEQKILSRDVMHETTMGTLDEHVQKKNREFCAEIQHMRGKLLGLIDGNHNWRFSNGVTASEDLANRMGTEHLGWLCHYTITFRFNKTRCQNVYFVLCHGRAGGKRIGTSINQVEDMKAVFPMADVYVMGHNHDRGAWPVDILYPTRDGYIKQKRQFLCRSGSFKKAYEKGKAGYEVGRLLRPADLGALKLNIGFHRDYEDGDRIITDIEAVI